ncbi:MAG: hypothetical protein OXU20_21500 [Myxococcales bacterium]|nr:hypothetical protein [Myxococcales bacterium]
MSVPGRAGRQRWKFGQSTQLAVMMTAAAACGPDRYLLYEIESSDGDGDVWMPHGGGCQRLNGGSSAGSVSGGAVDEAFSVSMTGVSGGVEFIVTVNGEVVAGRRFGEAFVDSGELQTVAFELSNGRKRRYHFWGAPGCGAPRPPIEGAEQPTAGDGQ